MKFQANQQTKDMIFIDILDDDNTILNKLSVYKNMHINVFYTKKYFPSHATDQKIIDFIKEATSFKFDNLTDTIKILENGKYGIYFTIQGRLHCYLKRQYTFVLCSKLENGKYWYNFGNNYNKPQQTEIINNILKPTI